MDHIHFKMLISQENNLCNRSENKSAYLHCAQLLRNPGPENTFLDTISTKKKIISLCSMSVKYNLFSICSDSTNRICSISKSSGSAVLSPLCIYAKAQI